MREVLFGQLRGKLAEFRRAAKERRQISPNDLGADTLDYCAAEVETIISTLESTAEWITVEDFAARKLVTPQTVRNWIRKKELEAEWTAKGWRIAPGAERRRKPLVMPKRKPKTKADVTELLDAAPSAKAG